MGKVKQQKSKTRQVEGNEPEERVFAVGRAGGAMLAAGLGGSSDDIAG